MQSSHGGIGTYEPAVRRRLVDSLRSALIDIAVLELRLTQSLLRLLALCNIESDADNTITLFSASWRTELVNKTGISVPSFLAYSASRRTTDSKRSNAATSPASEESPPLHT